MNKRGSGRGKPAKSPSELEIARLDAEVAKNRNLLGTVRVGLLCAALVASIWLFQPMVISLAGRATEIGITAAINVSFALGITVVFTGSMAAVQSRRANRARKRVGELTAELQVGQREAVTMQRRLEELTGDLADLRRDRERSKSR